MSFKHDRTGPWLVGDLKYLPRHSFLGGALLSPPLIYLV